MTFELELQALSQFAGVRFDLVQAGGGNSSVKIDDERMHIKASGLNLSQVTEHHGFVTVNYALLRSFFNDTDFAQMDKKQREQLGNEVTQKSLFNTVGKPSIETFLHALLNKYTLHTHSIAVNIVAAKKDWQAVFKELFPNCLCVGYETPGIDLARALSSALQAYEKTPPTIPTTIFLQNHGLIISAQSVTDVITLTESVTQRLEQHLNLNFSVYRKVSELQALLESCNIKGSLPYLVQDAVIHEHRTLLKANQGIMPFCPDTLVYCGPAPLILSGQPINASDNHALFKAYLDQYHQPPKVLLHEDQVLILASSLKKAREIEELLKFHLLVETTAGNTEKLTWQEIAYLSNWDAEKYRQEL